MAGWRGLAAGMALLALTTWVGPSSADPSAFVRTLPDTAAGAALQQQFGAQGLAVSEQAIEREAFELLATQGDALAATYRARHGRMVNTDEARELFPAYAADRSRAAAVHRPATLLAERVYADLLAAEGGEVDGVVFLAGGAGSGKTTALHRMMRSQPAGEVVTFDGTFADRDADLRRIRQARDAGLPVRVIYVHLDDPLVALANALARAEQMAAELGTGRTIPAAELVGLHARARQAFVAVAEASAADPQVTFLLVDHSGGPEQPREPLSGDEAVAFMRARQLDAAEVLRLQAAAEALVDERYRAGAISARTWRGFGGG